jgi:hypothetical protein
MNGRRRQQQKADLPKVVLDTGALIALDEQRPAERMRAVVVAAERAGRRLHIPAVVVAEWWRGDNLAHHQGAKMFKVEPVTDAIARNAGIALKDIFEERARYSPRDDGHDRHGDGRLARSRRLHVRLRGLGPLH